jgi:glycogen synthase
MEVRMARSPSRILMTVDSSARVWTHALELTRALGQHGVRVDLAVLGGPPDRARQAEAERAANVEVHFDEAAPQSSRMPEAWDHVPDAGDWLLKLRDRLQPDLVHLNGHAHAGLPWNLPTLVTTHTCLASRWFAVRPGRPLPLRWQRQGGEVRRALLAADAVVTPTHAMLEGLQKHYGPLGGARVILQGRDPSVFVPRAKQNYVMASGRLLDEAQNLSALDRAACALDWPVFLAGRQDLPGGGRINPEHMRRLGDLPTPLLAAWLGRASVFALPARYEPSGLAALEAALAGCALVLGDIPSLREVWDDAAVFVHPEDERSLLRALQRLATDATVRTRLSQRSRARALELSPARMAHQYLEAYVLAAMAYASKTAWLQRLGVVLAEPVVESLQADL